MQGIAALLVVAAMMLSGSAHSAELSADVFVTAKGKELFDAWIANPEGGFKVEPVEVASRGTFLSAVVLFQGCASDASGNCDAVVDITTFDPDGGVYGRIDGGELWQAKQGPGPGMTQLGVTFMGLMIEPKDPPGVYRVVAKATDRVSGLTVTTEASFSVK